MGDRVAVMKLGELQQVDTPLDLYDRPVNLFVAGFIGSPQMNLMEAHAIEGKAQIGDYLVPVDDAAAGRIKPAPTSPSACVRRRGGWSSENEGGLPVQITVVEELGSDAFVYGTSGVEGTPSNVIIRVNGRDKVHKGETVYVTTDPHHVHVFDTDTGERLSD